MRARARVCLPACSCAGVVHGCGALVGLVVLGIGATQRRVLEYLQNLNNDTATSIPTRITLIDGTHAETPATALLEARFRTAGARGGAGLSGDGGSTGPDGKDSPIAIAVWEYTFLLAPWLLPAATRRVIYVETDSWFLASPVGLWNQIDRCSQLRWHAG